MKNGMPLIPIYTIKVTQCIDPTTMGEVWYVSGPKIDEQGALDPTQAVVSSHTSLLWALLNFGCKVPVIQNQFTLHGPN